MTEPQNTKRGWFARWREHRRANRQQAIERKYFERERARSISAPPEDPMSNNASRRTIADRDVQAGLAILAIFAILTVLFLAYGGQADATAQNAPLKSAKETRHMSDNWNFEIGDLTSWHTQARGSGAWYVYSDGTRPPNPAETDPNVAFGMPQPPEGRFAAVTDMNAPGARILYRNVKLDGPTQLQMTVYYSNTGEFSSPAGLDFEGCEPNQQFRVDVLDAAAPPDTTAAKHVLATIFQTKPGDPNKLAPKTVTFDLSRWAGKKVRIRFAQVDNRGPLRAGVDDIRLAAIGS
jgi:hypothetical protein